MLYKWIAQQLHISTRKARKEFKQLGLVDQMKLTIMYIEHASEVKEPWYKRLHNIRAARGQTAPKKKGEQL